MMMFKVAVQDILCVVESHFEMTCKESEKVTQKNTILLKKKVKNSRNAIQLRMTKCGSDAGGPRDDKENGDQEMRTRDLRRRGRKEDMKVSLMMRVVFSL